MVLMLAKIILSSFSFRMVYDIAETTLYREISSSVDGKWLKSRFVCEPRLRNPRDSNKNLFISAGARVGRSVSGRSKFRRSPSNNRTRRRCDRVGGRACWRHVSITSNRPLRRSSRTNGIRRLVIRIALLYTIAAFTRHKHAAGTCRRI